MKYISEVLERAQKAQVNDSALIANLELKPGDRVIGILPPELRGLWAVLDEDATNMEELMQEAEKEVVGMAVTAPLGEFKAKVNEIKQRVAAQNHNYETVSDMFWSAVGRAIPETIKEPSIGIRKDWQVVAMRPPRRQIEGITLIEIPMLPGLAQLLRSKLG